MEQTVEPQMKFCKWCGHKIPREAVICTACGCQVEELKSSAPAVAPSIVVQNTNTSQSTSSGVGGGGVAAPRIRNKWVALVLCCLFGWFGAHKFYEGKVGRGCRQVVSQICRTGDSGSSMRAWWDVCHGQGGVTIL